MKKITNRYIDINIKCVLFGNFFRVELSSTPIIKFQGNKNNQLESFYDHSINSAQIYLNKEKLEKSINSTISSIIFNILKENINN